ncbi:probable IMP-specific 5'-nucleotidase 1 [Ramularia collo-cygni]|uniref:IMP-specific 5'-nucleotidase 1 n=1 Tax=Ramularia collo-cygni TaxID=112498 RepID=A0A2D3V6U6_9PEZI|nr:probable IMP-specific 5'-nucleotidase 1 [Ramularia collo-cygni]CZT16053.1 probable IMP-specific 5'-nucleotidase 1 [Ramularia collo-cygni]
MTTRYRVEYALKTHRRDQFIEWIKGLLAVPFVLLSQPTNLHESDKPSVEEMASTAASRYAQIMADVEALIADHIAHQNIPGSISKLKLLVPSVGTFFTPLPLQAAFSHQDNLRRISSRRFVAPSFNDIRIILNTAQCLSLTSISTPQSPSPALITFDGDVTLYEDGQNLSPSNPVIPRILDLMSRGVKIGIVTAAGYTSASAYHARLHGLLDAIPQDTPSQLVVMGGEANFLFQFNHSAEHKLDFVPESQWHLPEMSAWTEPLITSLLDTAEAALNNCILSMSLPVSVLRKSRAVGIYPPPGHRLSREQLEETVLVTQRVVEMSEAGKKIPFCAFNGGNDVFVDIGDKSWGVLCVQKFLGGVEGRRTLHVGDQFLSAGSNDFKARLAATTAWIASPEETCGLLDELRGLGRA